MFGIRYVCALALLLLTACNGTDEMRWKEQVYLHDGSTVVVDRFSTRASSGFPNFRRGKILFEEFRYPPLGVEWKSSDVREQLLAFDILDGVAYLVANSPRPTSFCAANPRGEPILVYYEWVNGQKKSISRAQIPLDEMRRNVTGLSAWGRDKSSDPAFLSWSDVARANMESGESPPVKLVELIAARSWLRCN
jgi:hypothetical protein